MKFMEIRDLCLAFSASQMNELELESTTSRIRFFKGSTHSKGPSPRVSPDLSQELLAGAIGIPDSVVTSPGVGRFLPCHPARRDDVYGPDRSVSSGETVGFIQVGFLLFPVESRFDGVIHEILVDPGASVEYDTALFKIRCQGAEE